MRLMQAPNGIYYNCMVVKYIVYYLHLPLCFTVSYFAIQTIKDITLKYISDSLTHCNK